MKLYWHRKPAKLLLYIVNSKEDSTRESIKSCQYPSLPQTVGHCFKVCNFTQHRAECVSSWKVMLGDKRSERAENNKN